MGVTTVGFTGASGVSVWESPEYAPMAWTAHQFERVNEGQLAERYQRGWPAVREPVFALDVAPGSSSAAISVAGYRADGLRHWELIDFRPGTDWAVQRVVDLFTADIRRNLQLLGVNSIAELSADVNPGLVRLRP